MKPAHRVKLCMYVCMYTRYYRGMCNIGAITFYILTTLIAKHKFTDVFFVILPRNQQVRSSNI